ncbi:hypothetical protein LguiB_026747 [Lonicera macranthoides]
MLIYSRCINIASDCFFQQQLIFGAIHLFMWKELNIDLFYMGKSIIKKKSRERWFLNYVGKGKIKAGASCTVENYLIKHY